LAGHADHPAHLLSGGQKQLLALASVLVTEPRIVVADEPTTLLDLRNTRMIRDAFAALDHQLVVVSHDLTLLDDFDRVIVFDEGRVVADDAPAAAIDAYERMMLR
jgi:biotin transport system ATP-binding protein